VLLKAHTSSSPPTLVRPIQPLFPLPLRDVPHKRRRQPNARAKAREQDRRAPFALFQPERSFRALESGVLGGFEKRGGHGTRGEVAGTAGGNAGREGKRKEGRVEGSQLGEEEEERGGATDRKEGKGRDEQDGEDEDGLRGIALGDGGKGRPESACREGEGTKQQVVLEGDRSMGGEGRGRERRRVGREESGRQPNETTRGKSGRQRWTRPVKIQKKTVRNVP
jgi:hypothetical protein